MALHDLTPQLRTRLSRVERAVGWFVLIATLLLAFGFGYYLYNTAQRKGWFILKAPYYIWTDRATGLKVGDPVKLMGFEVGRITKITAAAADDFAHNVFVGFEVHATYYGYLWTDGSRAKIGSADLLSNRTLEITRGTNGYPTYLQNPFLEISLRDAANLSELSKWFLGEEVYDTGGTNRIFTAKTPISPEILNRLASLGRNSVRVYDTREMKRVITAVWNDTEGRFDPFNGGNLYRLVVDESPAVTERLEELVGQVERALPNFLAVTNRINLVLSNSANLTSNLDLDAVSVRPALSNLSALTANLDYPGAIGERLIPTNLNHQLELTLGTANTTLLSANTTITNANAELTAIAEQISRSLENLADITSNLNSQVQANTNLLSSISSTIVHADEFVQGLKHHWLLRSAFKTKATNAPPAVPAQRLRSPKDER